MSILLDHMTNLYPDSDQIDFIESVKEKVCDIIEKLESHYYDIRFALRVYRVLWLFDDIILINKLLDFDKVNDYNHRRVDQFYNEIAAYLDREYE